MISETSPDL